MKNNDNTIILNNIFQDLVLKTRCCLRRCISWVQGLCCVANINHIEYHILKLYLT